MHYKAMLFTKELPSKEEIDKIMKPYRWEEKTAEYPVFTYDYYSIGGRYKGNVKLKIDTEDEYYNWSFYACEPRNGRVFWSCMLETMRGDIKPDFMFSEEDYFANMGSRDGYILVDGARVKDIINFDDIESYICIDQDGTAIARASWDGNDFIEDKDYEEKFKAVCERNRDAFLTILDIHD